MKKIFYQIMTGLPMFATCLMLASCGDSGSDSTGENWILAIILLICWLKGK